jgi:hypothetical protein
MNDEFRMTKSEGMTRHVATGEAGLSNDEAQKASSAGLVSSLGLRHSFVILHSDFVI